MSDTDATPETDPASQIPMASPLTGVAAEPDQPDPSEVLPMGDVAAETGHLVPDDEK